MMAHRSKLLEAQARQGRLDYLEAQYYEQQARRGNLIMSSTFERDMSPEEMERVAQVVGKPVAFDQRTILFDQMNAEMRGQELCQLARELKTAVQLEMNKPGDEKTVNGQRFRLMADGWQEVRKPPKQALAAIQRARAERAENE